MSHGSPLLLVVFLQAILTLNPLSLDLAFLLLSPGSGFCSLPGKHLSEKSMHMQSFAGVTLFWVCGQCSQQPQSKLAVCVPRPARWCLGASGDTDDMLSSSLMCLQSQLAKVSTALWAVSSIHSLLVSFSLGSLNLEFSGLCMQTPSWVDENNLFNVSRGFM